VLAGTVFGYKAHQDYFEGVLRPKLNGMHRFIGPVGGIRKEELLANAQCLLIPSLVSETSSLVAMEALACGTPVVAFRRGALPEIVVHGETGYVVDTPDEMADAIIGVRDLSPSRCREYALAHFSAEKMAARYFRLYEEVRSMTLSAGRKVA
jgi:glycosyltransferase involved in cell wall biosynthesis